MKKSSFKPIIAGMLTGAALFFMPFFLWRVFAFFLIGGAFFRLFIGRRMRSGFGMRPAFADKIRSMSDEEYNLFKQKAQQHCGKNRDTEATAAATK
jgi:hypothetical protein